MLCFYYLKHTQIVGKHGRCSEKPQFVFIFGIQRQAVSSGSQQEAPSNMRKRQEQVTFSKRCQMISEPCTGLPICPGFSFRGNAFVLVCQVGDVFRFPNVPALSVMEQSLAHGFSFLLQKNTRLKLSREWMIIAALPLAWFMASRWHFPAQRSVAEIWCLRTDLSECTGQCGSGGHYLRGTRTNFLIGEIYLGVATPRNRPMK